MKAVLIAGLAFASVAAASLRADPVLDWNALMIDGIRADNSGPTLSTRNLAILHTAIYDAVNSVVRTHQPYRFQATPPSNTSAEAAAVGAAYQITTVLYSGLRGRADDLYENFIAVAPDAVALTNGLVLGQTIAQQMLASRAADGSQTEVPYIPSADPGQWRRTPPFFRPPLTPQWRYVDPFCLPSLDPFLPPPPPALDSREYAEAFNEVKEIGGTTSTVRTAEQGLIAQFWSDFSYTSMPPGHWHLIAATISQSQGTTLIDNARLFALLSLAQADAAILCWEVKFKYNLWRPITAIQRADEDNNPLTEADLSWNHFLASPPFPAYTSGHSTFSKASSQVLTHFYGTDAISFTATSDFLPGVFRSFDSLAACADEVGMSRIYGGIHYMFDNVQGKRTGGAIGDYVFANYLLPESALPGLRIEGLTNGAPILRIHGHVGTPCEVQATEDFNQGWTTISTGTAEPGGIAFVDTAARASRQRFYRVVER